MNPVDLIVAKRNGETLSADAIQSIIAAYTKDDLPDYQMSAFLMAAFLRGMTDEETAVLTDCMLHSGEVLDLSAIPGIKVDKHSTGGVGDKVSILLAPLVAACGVPVPMISGRGLGHSGGTLDKLESIPGFRVDLDVRAYRRQLERIGVVMIGQTDEIAPADRRLYALRDVTGTVEFVPFIASSIMSKKLAEGIDALVLDVKCGRGAFMKTEEEARELAETLVGIGERFGKPTVAWMTEMDQPLGFGVGNWPEVEECIRCMHGERVDDLLEVTLTLAGEMLHLGGVAESPASGYQQAEETLASGKVLEKTIELVEMQGGDSSVVKDPALRPGPSTSIAVHASSEMNGYITQLDALAIGKAAVALGAGRIRKEDPVDPTAGIVLTKKEGDAIKPGELLATLFTSRPIDDSALINALQRAYTVSAEKMPAAPLLMGRYTISGWENAPNSKY